MREKLNLLCINLESMPYVCEKEYRLIKSENVKKNLFMAKDEKDACYQILSIGL